jgi:peptide/nickel transport system permease protein
LPWGWTYPRSLAALILVLALVAGLAAPALVSLFGLMGPLRHDPSALNLFGNPTGPSAGHPLGVDAGARDVLSRILYGLRSLVVLSLAGTAFAALAGGVLAVLAQLNRWLAYAISLVLGALESFPPVLLGLGLALGLGPGVWRLVVAIALVVLTPARVRRPAGWRGVAPWLGAHGPWLVIMLRNAVAIDFALTFLGDGPGGRGPQLGAMVAQAGLGILRGVPAWWALLFPGLVVVLVAAAASVLAGAYSSTQARPVEPGRLWPPTVRGYVGERVTVALGRALCVIGLAAVMFSSLDGRDHGGHSALASLGSDVSATLSLLLGAVVVWLLVTLVQLRLGTRAHVRRPLTPGRLARMPALVVGAAPVGWLAFLALYLFSDSVGKLPLLPGAATYVGLQHPGRWAESLVIPWLLLGGALAARAAPTLEQAIREVTVSGQQRVARAAGVPERRLARQRRRALNATLLELAHRHVSTLLSLSVSIEASFEITGLGALSVAQLGHGGAASVADLATLYALTVVAVRLVLELARLLADPSVASAPETVAS